MVTPTTRATWLNVALVHEVLVQPRKRYGPIECDLLVACCGYIEAADSRDLRTLDEMVTCLSCIGTNWKATVDKMDADGLLTKVKDIATDSVLHRILMEGGAFADSALKSNRR